LTLSKSGLTPVAPAEPASPADLVAAMRQRLAWRNLDAALLDLVAEKAAEFARLTPRERAAVAWAEAVISTGKSHVADEVYVALREHFDDEVIARLTAIAGTAHVRARLGEAD